MKLTQLLTLSLLLVAPLSAQKAKSTDLTAKPVESFMGAATSKPAPRWEEGMLTGNGNMGGIALGNPYNEVIFMSQQEGFLPKNKLAQIPRLADKMKGLKKQALAAGNKGPLLFHEKVMDLADNSKTSHYDTFHPAYFLKLKMAADNPKNYLRTQNFGNGEVVTRWSDSKGKWQRDFFISRTDDVAVVRLKGPKGSVSCDLAMEIKVNLVKSEFESKDGFVSAHTTYVKGKGGYDSVIRVVTNNGTVKHTNKGVSIRDADEILLIMKVRHWRTPLPKNTNDAWAFNPDNSYFKSPDYKTNYISDMRTSLSKLVADYDQLLKPHAAVHGEIFSRVKIDLGGSDIDRKKTSEQLMAEPYSLALLERAYNACRYLMISANGKYPPHLQGIWNGDWTPMWGCGYHLNSNLQLCIQGNMSANMPELMEGYFKLVESWIPDCKLNAKVFYNCRGAVSRLGVVSTDALLNRIQKFPGEIYTSCLGWLGHYFYDYYQFTGDKKFLKNRAVPLLKEVALFYEDLLKGTEDKNGKYRFWISASPENPYKYINSTIDIATAKAMHIYLITACKELGIEKENIKVWEKFIAKLPDYKIDEKGQLQEWAVDGAKQIFNQRHHSAFLQVYQYCEFDREKTPKLWEASQRAFDGKIKEWFHNRRANSQHITHGMANQGQCAARLGRGEIVGQVLQRLLTNGYLLPNFMMHYWPKKAKRAFGMDPIGALPDIINNSLLFAWSGTLDVLPALPKRWSKGSISGILLRDQISADHFVWSEGGRNVELSLTSKKTQEITIRFPEGFSIKSVKKVTSYGAYKAIPGKKHSYKLTLPANQKAVFRITTEIEKEIQK